MSPSKRTIFLDTPFQGDLQTDFCWCPKRLRYLRFRYPQSFQNLGYPRKFTLKVILDTGRLVRKWLSEYSWICLLGDVLPMVPSCITIFHHHLEENFGWNFSKHRRVANPSIVKELFLWGFMFFVPKKAERVFWDSLFPGAEYYHPLLQWGGNMWNFQHHPRGNVRNDGRCFILFWEWYLYWVRGLDIHRKRQSNVCTVLVCLICENWLESMYALLETNWSPLPMQFGRFPNFPSRGICASQQLVKMLASNKPWYQVPFRTAANLPK